MKDISRYATGTVCMGVKGYSEPIIGTLFYNSADGTYSVYGEYTHERGIGAEDIESIEFLKDIEFTVLSHGKGRWMISIHKKIEL